MDNFNNLFDFLTTFANETNLLTQDDLNKFKTVWPNMLPERQAATQSVAAIVQTMSDNGKLHIGAIMDTDERIDDACRTLAELITDYI